MGNILGKSGGLRGEGQDADDYEKELSSIDKLLKQCKVEHAQIIQRNQHYRSLFLLFSGLTLMLLVFLTYVDTQFSLPRSVGGGWCSVVTVPWSHWIQVFLLRGRPLTISESKLLWKGIWLVTIVFDATLLYCGYQSLSYWMERRLNYADAQLNELKLQQKNKLEELKKKTKFYLMKELVEKYERPSIVPSTSTSGNLGYSAAPIQLNPTSMSAGYSVPANPGLNMGNINPVSQGNLNPENQRITNPQSIIPNVPPLVPLSKLPVQVPTKTGHTTATGTLVDRLLDYLIGTSPPSGSVGTESIENPFTNSSTSSLLNKRIFALICQACGNHNGLVNERDYLSLRYQCPRCRQWQLPQMQQKEKVENSGNLDLTHRTPILDHGLSSCEEEDSIDLLKNQLEQFINSDHEDLNHIDTTSSPSQRNPIESESNQGPSCAPMTPVSPKGTPTTPKVASAKKGRKKHK